MACCVPYIATNSLAAAAGSAFDCFVKCAIATDLGFVGDEYDLDKLLTAQIEHEELRAQAIPMGRNLFKHYVDNGCYDRLLKEGIDFLITKPKEGNIGEVPVLGIPDGFMSDGTPIEFKVNGAFSATGQSPKQGYKEAWTSRLNKGPHAKFGIPMELIDADWAAQLAIYTWQFWGGVRDYAPFKVAVEQIAVRGSTIVCASFRTTIGTDFQKLLHERLKRTWDKILNNNTSVPPANKERCHMWGQRCDAADQCSSYKAWQAMPYDFRGLIE